MTLTDIALKSLKPATAQYKRADSGGLYVLVKPNGTKVWRFDYRFFGVRKTLAFGQYPAISLAEAREKRDAAKKLIANGRDPGAQKKADRVAAENDNANTFGAVVTSFLARMEALGRSKATVGKNRWMLEVVAERLSLRPISEITSSELLEVLSKVEASGRLDTAVATRAAIGRVFRLAILKFGLPSDPTYALRGALQAPEVVSHPAIIAPADVGGLMRALYGYDGWPTLRAALKMQALCFARPSETRTMMWREIDWESHIWSIPPEKAKMRRVHDVPLSRQALTLLEEMQKLSGQGSRVFPSMMSGKAFLSENSMNSALRRMGFTSDQHTAHGFRSTASTILNESKLFHEDVIEVQLAHLDKNRVRRVYNRAAYWDDRVRMMQWWANFLDEVRLGLGS